eukprot:2784060-Rhodomonas_salina.2
MVLPGGAEADVGGSTTSVWCYAPAMRWPVLKATMVLPGGRGDAAGEEVSCAMSGTDLAYGAMLRMLLPSYVMRCLGTDKPYGFICLRACCAMSGTERAYGATRQVAVAVCRLLWYLRGSHSYLPTRCPVLTWLMVRAYYAMSGTDLAYGATTRVQGAG